MIEIKCPKCSGEEVSKSGVIVGRQRYKCKNCSYHFSVNKLGRSIDKYYVIKALQLYLEGISLREIERILGVSHVSVMNWVKQYGIKPLENNSYHPTYKVLSHEELVKFMSSRDQIAGTGMIITELGDKFMVIKWERFRA